MEKAQSLKSAIYVLPEAMAWVLGLLLLACMEPGATHLFSFCPISWIWESGCLGCGLGNSIAYIFRGDILASWQAHPLALPVLALLLVRVRQLVLLSYTLYKNHTHI